jgi:DNA-binding response OmpR family regulator
MRIGGDAMGESTQSRSAMSATVFRAPVPNAFSPSALVIEPDLRNLLFILSTLSGLGLDTAVAETFRDAKSLLATMRPVLLLTSVRLHEFNGLHLVLRGRSTWPGLPAIVTTPSDDVVLRREAEDLGATFMALPVSSQEMAAAICRTVLCVASGPASPLRPPFERRSNERRSVPAVYAAERRSRDRRLPFTLSLRNLTPHSAE